MNEEISCPYRYSSSEPPITLAVIQTLYCWMVLLQIITKFDSVWKEVVAASICLDGLIKCDVGCVGPASNRILPESNSKASLREPTWYTVERPLRQPSPKRYQPVTSISLSQFLPSNSKLRHPFYRKVNICTLKRIPQCHLCCSFRHDSLSHAKPAAPSLVA
jgi:hypothetical protein